MCQHAGSAGPGLWVGCSSETLWPKNPSRLCWGWGGRGAGFALCRCSQALLPGWASCSASLCLARGHNVRAAGRCPHQRCLLLHLGQELAPPRTFPIFLLLLLSAGRRSKFAAEEVDAQSPGMGWQMPHRCGHLAAPRLPAASSPSQKPHVWPQPGGWFAADASPTAGSWGCSPLHQCGCEPSSVCLPAAHGAFPCRGWCCRNSVTLST